MEDYDHPSDSEPMISSFFANLILVSLLWLMLIITGIIALVNGEAREYWNEDPRGFTRITIFIIVFALVVTIIGLFIGYFETKNEKKKKGKKDYTSKFNIEKSPILYQQVDNTNGEFRSSKCFICQEYLEENLEIVLCPECKSIFHLEHLKEYILENKVCPYCKYELKK